MNYEDNTKFNEYVEIYKNISIENKLPIPRKQLSKYNLPSNTWFIKRCPDKSVNTWGKFVNWCGFYSYSGSSKEDVSVLLYNMEKMLGHTISYNDIHFRTCGAYSVPMSAINKYWGTINKMKKDLGMEIIQESMIDKSLNKDAFMYATNKLFDYAKQDNIQTITRKYIQCKHDIPNYDAFNKASKKFLNMNFNEYLNMNGFSIGNLGSGCIFKYDDGEIAESIYEQIFSNYLRKIGLKYNIDYFRNVKYKTFSKCNNNMNCDYIIHYNNKIIYIEIAGILENYKSYYYKDKEIVSSKSKEKYRLDLKEKENMLKHENLIYFILFPCDLTYSNFNMILNNPNNIDKKNMENFIKNNINWNQIDVGVGVIYSDVIKYGRNMIVYQ